MSGDRQTFVLVSERVRTNAARALQSVPDGYVVKIGPPTRSGEQNDKFHAICTDLAKSDMKWAGKRRTKEEWKAILVSGHAVATKHDGEVIPGIEGEFVAIRESSASMSVARAASLITYTLAFCDTNQIPLHETRAGGFLDARAA